MKPEISGWSMSRHTIFAARGAVEHLEKRHETRRRAAAGELLLLAADGAEVRARPRPVLEEARLGLHEVVDGHQVVLRRLDEASRALRALVGRLRLDDGPGLLVPRPVPARAGDLVLVPEPEVEPDGRVEGPELIHQQVRALGLERVGVVLRREVAAAGRANRMREAMHHLPHARLARVLVPVETGLAKVLRDEDV